MRDEGVDTALGRRLVRDDVADLEVRENTTEPLSIVPVIEPPVMT